VIGPCWPDVAACGVVDAVLVPGREGVVVALGACVVAVGVVGVVAGVFVVGVVAGVFVVGVVAGVFVVGVVAGVFVGRPECPPRACTRVALMPDRAPPTCSVWLFSRAGVWPSACSVPPQEAAPSDKAASAAVTTARLNDAATPLRRW
jgi:hypothetical protein